MIVSAHPPPSKPTFKREPAVAEEMARAVLGKAGRVSVARSIWKKCVPVDLLDVSLRAFRSSSDFPTPNSRSPSKLRKMMNSVRLDASGLRITGRPASATAFLRYKNKTKCRLLLNATKINAIDDRRPPQIKLPSLQLLADRLARPAGKRLWMAKLDQPTPTSPSDCQGRGEGCLWCGCTERDGGTPASRLAGSTHLRSVSVWCEPWLGLRCRDCRS